HLGGDDLSTSPVARRSLQGRPNGEPRGRGVAPTLGGASWVALCARCGRRRVCRRARSSPSTKRQRRATTTTYSVRVSAGSRGRGGGEPHAYPPNIRLPRKVARPRTDRQAS